MSYLQLLVNGIVSGSIYGLAALGFNMIYGTTKIFHVAYGSVMMVSLYLVTAISLTAPTFYWGMVVGVFSALVLGALVYLVLYLPLERLGRSRTTIFIASLGLATLLEAVLPWIYGPQPLSFFVPRLTQIITIGGISVSPMSIAAVIMALVFSVAFWAVLRWTKFGRQLRAVTSNTELGSVMGIRRVGLLTTVFAFGTAIGLLGMTIQTMGSSVTPTIDVSYTLIAAIIVLGGGAGSLLGSYVVALAFGILQDGITRWVSADWATVIVYGAFTLLILIRPVGLMSSSSKRIL